MRYGILLLAATLIFPPILSLPTAPIKKITVKHIAGHPLYDQLNVAPGGDALKSLTLAVPRDSGTHTIMYLIPDRTLTLIRAHTDDQKVTTWHARVCHEWCNQPLTIGWCTHDEEYIESDPLGEPKTTTRVKKAEGKACTRALKVSTHKIKRIPLDILNVAHDEIKQMLDASDQETESAQPSQSRGELEMLMHHLEQMQREHARVTKPQKKGRAPIKKARSRP